MVVIWHSFPPHFAPVGEEYDFICGDQASKGTGPSKPPHQYRVIFEEEVR